MIRRTLTLAALALATRAALAAEPAVLSLYLFDADLPLADADVLVDGVPRGRTSSDGALQFSLEAGKHVLSVQRGADDLMRLQLDVQAEENTQLIATLREDGEPEVLRESSAGMTISHVEARRAPTAGVVPGVLHGRVVSTENGKPVAGARVYVAGTPLDLVTDANGEYSASLAPGQYSISVLAPNFASLTLDGVDIAAEVVSERHIELTPAGVELPEFVVLEPFVEGSLAAFVEEKRTSSAVADILGAEQISRAGDSDAAGALKRVTGLTLVDGKFVYVRGLGERYSSTLLNGAQVPSPDPTRRVVPLDLFPTEILSGIVVQKTWSVDMPAEFAGGTIQLRTRGVPEDFFLKTSVNLGYADGTTGDEGLRYGGGDRDWTGFDGARGAPAGLLEPHLPTGPAELEALGEAVAAQGYDIQRRSIGPNGSFSFGVGDRFKFGDGDWSLGYITALRYAQDWDSRSEDRTFYGLTRGELVPLENYTREKTERAIDASGFLAAGLEIGEHHSIDASLIRVRQTTDMAEIDQGITESGNNDRINTLEWIENELVTRQLQGEHSFPALGDLHGSWRATDAHASRYAPNRRTYRFTYNEQLEDYTFESFNEQRYEFLDDNAREYALDLDYPIPFNEVDRVILRAGSSRLKRDRESSIRRFRFGGRRPNNQPVFDYEDLLQPGNIGAGGLVLQDRSLPTDAYTADVSLDATYLGANLLWGDWTLDAGVREESITQTVTTVRPFDPNATPEVGELQARSRLPSAALTWRYSDDAQLRLGFSQTVARPDIREQSRSNFIDPILDIRVEGNPDLEQTDIENLDLRWEYYFSTLESFSVAFFSKDFSKPIELVSSPASGSLLGLTNADTATNRGIEFDLYRSLGTLRQFDWMPGWMRPPALDNVFVGFNYARIDSTVDLGANQGIQTNAQRPLQGQSSYVGNVSLAYIDPQGKLDATLLYNVFGPRISQVGVSGKPDVYEQPFDQLDFTMSAQLPWQGWKFKAKLKNLLDPEARFTQGGLPTRSFHKGREFSLGLEWTY